MAQNDSDERYEIVRAVTDICFENGGVTKPMADNLADYVEQYANKARLSELKDFRKNWHTMIRQEVHQDLNDRIAKLTKLEAEL